MHPGNFFGKGGRERRGAKTQERGNAGGVKTQGCGGAGFCASLLPSSVTRRIRDARHLPPRGKARGKQMPRPCPKN